MAWCEKCGGEYREGITVCYKCGAELTDESQSRKAKKKKLKVELTRNREEAFLFNTNSLIELNYITSMLDEMEIEFRVIEEDTGQYLSIIHGRSYTGKSVYVEKNRFEDAKAALDNLDTMAAENDDADDLDYGTPSIGARLFKNAFRVVVVIMVAVFALVMLGAAGFMIFNLIAR